MKSFADLLESTMGKFRRVEARDGINPCDSTGCGNEASHKVRSANIFQCQRCIYEIVDKKYTLIRTLHNHNHGRVT
jgi:hypothetical protein